ncbi:hypothetical protein INR49_007911 [Caranx melampygus]|nr:hypothetical protein INR49_007911 [Caranx melampygus]
MFPPRSTPSSPALRLLMSVVMVMLMTSLPVSGVDPETCFSRQHQSAKVNVRVALTRPGTLMEARPVRSDKDCVLACCSGEVKPGAKCNMAMFSHIGEDNCLLFHCPTEQDSPPPIIIIATMPAITPSPTTTTAATTTTTTAAAPTVASVTTKKPNKTSKKQNKPTKKGKPHPVSSITTTANAANAANANATHHELQHITSCCTSRKRG